MKRPSDKLRRNVIQQAELRHRITAELRKRARAERQGNVIIKINPVGHSSAWRPRCLKSGDGMREAKHMPFFSAYLDICCRVTNGLLPLNWSSAEGCHRKNKAKLKSEEVSVHSRYRITPIGINGHGTPDGRRWRFWHFCHLLWLIALSLIFVAAMRVLFGC